MNIAGVNMRYALFWYQVVPKRQCRTTILRCVKSQKIEDLIYIAAEASNHAEIQHVQIGYANTASQFAVPMKINK